LTMNLFEHSGDKSFNQDLIVSSLVTSPKYLISLITFILSQKFEGELMACRIEHNVT